VVQNQFINYDLEANPLQIKTDSKTGSYERINLPMYKEDADNITDYYDLGYLYIQFSDPVRYWVKYCHTDWKDTKNLPSEQNKIWTFTKTSNNLTIECNGVKVLDLDFKGANSACASKWSQDVAKITFWQGGRTTDTASDEYRMAPKTCTSLPDIVNLEIESGKLPVEQGTEITVKCSEGFILEGNNVLTCNHGKLSRDTLSCSKSKKQHCSDLKKKEV
jgi:hypothetical protein